MDLYKIGFKISVRRAQGMSPDRVIAAFHRWIQTAALPDHLLIDVHDYTHIEGGGGVLLVGHEANVSTDRGGWCGLFYQRKQPLEGSLEDRVRTAFGYGLRACRLLETEEGVEGKLAFGAEKVRFTAHDRLLAPNVETTRRELEPVLRAALEPLYGDAGPLALEWDADPKSLTTVTISTGAEVDVETLLSRVDGLAGVTA